jgi:hypothetical protein
MTAFSSYYQKGVFCEFEVNSAIIGAELVPVVTG